MANKLTIQHKRSSVSGNAPAAGVLQPGELAVNFADKKLFTEDGAGNVLELGGGSNWTTETNGISRSDRIKVGSNADPLVAMDVVGTIGQNVTAGAAVNASLGQVWTVDSSTNPTVSITGTIPTSTTLVLNISGGGTVTWPATIKWPAGTAPTWSTGTDVVTLFTYDAGATWVGNAYALDAQ